MWRWSWWLDPRCCFWTVRPRAAAASACVVPLTRSHPPSSPSLAPAAEPTSGLDATASLELMHCLQRIAAGGTTVVAVIHQPRAAIFDMVDHLLLLVKSGRVAYSGPAADAVRYVVGLGVGYVPPNASGSDRTRNPADWLLDVLTGLEQPRPAARAVAAKAGGTPAPSRAGMPLGWPSVRSSDVVVMAPGDAGATTTVPPPLPSDVASAAAGGGRTATPPSALDGVDAVAVDDEDDVVLEASLTERRRGLIVDLPQLWLQHQMDVVKAGEAPTSEGTPVADTKALVRTLSSQARLSFLAQVWEHAKRTLRTRLRYVVCALVCDAARRVPSATLCVPRLRSDAGRLRLAFILHCAMAVVLSTGFSVLIQASYRNTIVGPYPSALAAYCPAPLKVRPCVCVCGAVCKHRRILPRALCIHAHRRACATIAIKGTWVCGSCCSS